MTKQTLIPQAEVYGSADPVTVDERDAAVSQTTRDVSGGIVRDGVLLRDSDSETGWDRADELGTTNRRKTQFASPLIRLPSGTLPKERIKVLQQWEGIVTAVTDDSFFAELQDLGDVSQPLEIVEILIAEVPEEDRSLLVEGAIFYWSIGYETSLGGQLKRISEIRMRRTLRWTKRALQRASKRAEELVELHSGQ